MSIASILVGAILTTSSPVLFGDKPDIMTRDQWGAKPIQAPFKPHKPFKITVHHAGVATNRNRSFEDKLRGLQAWSQRNDKLAGGKEKPAWPDIPYHWYIDWTGRIADCRDPNVAGDTNTEYDPTGHYLICLEGNFEVEQPTGEQIRALNNLVFWIAESKNVPAVEIEAHLDHSKQTSCPGKNLYGELEKLRWRVDWLRLAAGRK